MSGGRLNDQLGDQEKPGQTGTCRAGKLGSSWPRSIGFIKVHDTASRSHNIRSRGGEILRAVRRGDRRSAYCQLISRHVGITHRNRSLEHGCFEECHTQLWSSCYTLWAPASLPISVWGRETLRGL